MIKQLTSGQTAAEADWLIGAGLLGAERHGQGAALDEGRHRLRRRHPRQGPAARPHGDDYVRTFEDNGGVHINSGIPNKAFYLLATNLGGNSWHARAIWYDALRSPLLSPTATFRQFAASPTEPRGGVPEPGSEQMDAVREAWAEVGVRWE